MIYSEKNNPNFEGRALKIFIYNTRKNLEMNLRIHKKDEWIKKWMAIIMTSVTIMGNMAGQGLCNGCGKMKRK